MAVKKPSTSVAIALERIPLLAMTLLRGKKDRHEGGGVMGNQQKIRIWQALFLQQYGLRH
jgi:hypothetical protein